jgi:glycosyltransferase involved in cell wall biosynthesis
VLLETADVLAVPSVVARDGDRDTMPVVAKEALALEVPVVGSALGGLPELLRPPHGRLVAPGDPAALATALAAVLGAPPAERAAAGAAGTGRRGRARRRAPRERAAPRARARGPRRARALTGAS